MSEVIVMIIQFPSATSRFAQTRASLYITVATAFIEELLTVLVVLILARTASWIVMARYNQGKLTAKRIKLIAYLVCAVLFIPHIASLAMDFQCLSELYTDENIRRGLYLRTCDNRVHINRMRIAYMVLSFCTGVTMAIFSIILVVHNNRQPEISNTVRSSLDCSIVATL